MARRVRDRSIGDSRERAGRRAAVAGAMVVLAGAGGAAVGAAGPASPSATPQTGDCLTGVWAYSAYSSRPRRPAALADRRADRAGPGLRRRVEPRRLRHRHARSRHAERHLCGGDERDRGDGVARGRHDPLVRRRRHRRIDRHSGRWDRRGAGVGAGAADDGLLRRDHGPTGDRRWHHDHADPIDPGAAAANAVAADPRPQSGARLPGGDLGARHDDRRTGDDLARVHGGVDDRLPRRRVDPPSRLRRRRAVRGPGRDGAPGRPELRVLRHLR